MSEVQHIALQQMDVQDMTGRLSTLSSLFQLNEKGQLSLQIHQDVVSIGAIECTLSIQGFLAGVVP